MSASSGGYRRGFLQLCLTRPPPAAWNNVLLPQHDIELRKESQAQPKLQNFPLPFDHRFFSSGSNCLPVSAGRSRCSGLACVYLLPQINRRYFWEVSIRGCRTMTLARSKIKVSFFESWAAVAVVWVWLCGSSCWAGVCGLRAVVSGLGELRGPSRQADTGSIPQLWWAGWLGHQSTLQPTWRAAGSRSMLMLVLAATVVCEGVCYTFAR